MVNWYILASAIDTIISCDSFSHPSHAPATQWSLIYNESSVLTHGNGGMPNEAARFYTACIVMGLEHLHDEQLRQPSCAQCV